MIEGLERVGLLTLSAVVLIGGMAAAAGDVQTRLEPTGLDQRGKEIQKAHRARAASPGHSRGTRDDEGHAKPSPHEPGSSVD